MSMSDWAQREIEIACKHENPDFVIGSGEFDYGCSCYESALKAYKSIASDGHSGFSFGLTKNILIRLLEGKPIIPIEDVPEIWNELGEYGGVPDLEKHYQCQRMSSLFKYEYTNGRIEYRDVDRVYGQDISDPNSRYTSKLTSDVVNDLFPIIMPYNPETKPYIVMTETFLSDINNGDYDTKGLIELITPEKEHIPLNEWYKEVADGWKRISNEEYLERKFKSKMLEETKC